MLVQRTNLQGNHNKPEKGEGGIWKFRQNKGIPYVTESFHTTNSFSKQNLVSLRIVLKGLNVENFDAIVTNMGMANSMSENMLFEILIFDH